MGDAFNNTVDSLFKGMDSFLSTKTVVGEAIHIGDTILLPLVDVSFGCAAGSFAKDAEGPKNRHQNTGGGLGGRLTPSAVLVISNGQTKLVNIKNQDSITKILDMVPDIIDKVTAKKNGTASNAQVKEATEALDEMLTDAIN